VIRRRRPTRLDVDTEIATLAAVLESPTQDQRSILYALGAKTALEWTQCRTPNPMVPSTFLSLLWTMFAKVLPFQDVLDARRPEDDAT